MVSGFIALIDMWNKSMSGVKQRSHGANPAAEEAAKKKSESDKDERRPHQRYKFFSGQRSTGSQERIDPEKDVYSIREFIVT